MREETVVVGRSIKAPFAAHKKAGLLGGINGKESTSQCRRCGFDPEVGKIPWRRNDNPLQYACLGNPVHRRA